MYQAPEQNSKCRGMTLIEVLFALMLLTLMIMVLSGLVMQAMKAEQQEGSYTAGTLIAETVIEQLKTSIVKVDDFNNLASTDYKYVTDFDNYIYKVDVTSLTTSVDLVRVTVYFRDFSKTYASPDTRKVNGGKIMTLGTNINRP
ncbi:MAG: prepilin-type N-terminal cleavage/methylation domain-containing protein [Firmicutes bacterium]|nr:prepilin-type N-terminal cleavage/methylation domain-containing protein [Bacillota bacterium]